MQSLSIDALHCQLCAQHLHIREHCPVLSAIWSPQEYSTSGGARALGPAFWLLASPGEPSHDLPR
eukprot:6068469-Amphidinium_carterae.1